MDKLCVDKKKDVKPCDDAAASSKKVWAVLVKRWLLQFVLLLVIFVMGIFSPNVWVTAVFWGATGFGIGLGVGLNLGLCKFGDCTECMEKRMRGFTLNAEKTETESMRACDKSDNTSTRANAYGGGGGSAHVTTHRLRRGMRG